MTFSTNVTSDFLNQLRTSEFLSFALKISSDKSQKKHNLTSKA